MELTAAIARGTMVPKTEPNDDMHDSLEDGPYNQPLRDVLTLCRGTVEVSYRKADALALRHQRYHRLLTIIAAVFGTFAVLLAIVQLSGLFPGMWPVQVSGIAAAFALIAVIAGLVSSQQLNWLLERHKAERYRLLKFRFLIDPVLWSGDKEKVKARINRLIDEVADITKLNRQALHQWIDEDEIPEVPITPPGKTDEKVIRDFYEYYQKKRLSAQMDYFSARARGNVRMHRYTWFLPPLFFFSSILAVSGHFIYNIVASAHGLESKVATSNLFVLFVVLAAAFPVIGAGVRSLRTAYEFARNNSRFRAKLIALSRLAERLRRENNLETMFRDLWSCEQILESEHREWLRLMVEGEWFG
jgi:hypothetical protein